MNESNLQILLDDDRAEYQPGAMLSGAYGLEQADGVDIQRIEASVLWFTEGKGDEDLGVHFFEEVEATPEEPIDPAIPRKFATPLPLSPLSYDGFIIKIRWCVRVRMKLAGSEELLAEAPFQLGKVTSAREEES
jgi:hypothetical protein